MKLLLHTCCAPCSVYWYNPNIHPYMEYKARRDTLKEYTKNIRYKCYI